MFAASAVHAQINLYWDGQATGYDNVQNVDGASNGGTGFWTTDVGDANWDNGVAEIPWPNTANFVAVFGGSISGRAFQNGSTLTVGGMMFQRDGYVVDGGTLNLGQYGITTTAPGSGGTQDATASGVYATTTANYIASNINLTANQTWTVTNAADTLLVNGVIADTTGFTLTKAGAGTLTLGNYNTYTGGTIVNAGTLTLAKGNAAAGTVQGVVTVNSGATLKLTAGDAIGYGTGAVTTINLNGGSLTASAGNEGFVTSYNLTGGSVTGTSLFRFNINAAAPPSISSLSSPTTSVFASGIDVYPNSGNAGNLAINVASGSTASGIDLAISGAIGQSGFTSTPAGINKTGAGYLNLTGQNSFTGPVIVSNGTVNVGVQGAGNGGSGALGLSNTTGKTITVGSGAALSGTVNNWFGNQTNTNLPTITVNGGTLSTTRYTTIGALNLNGAAVTNSVTQDAGNYQSFALRGDVTVGGTAPSTIAATAADATHGGVHLGANTTFTVASTGSAIADLTVSAPLRNQSGDFGNAAGGLTKTGSGKMLLSAANTYIGATVVNAGTLLVNGSTAAASVVTVNNSGTVLGGTGTISGAATINAGGSITGGDVGTVGALTLQSTVTLNGGTYVVDINGTTADRLTISGALSLTGANITFTGMPTAPSYVLATFASETGAFSGTAPNGYAFQFNAGGTELDLVAVPEPATWLAGALLVGFLGLRYGGRKAAGQRQCFAAVSSRIKG